MLVPPFLNFFTFPFILKANWWYLKLSPTTFSHKIEKALSTSSDSAFLLLLKL